MTTLQCTRLSRTNYIQFLSFFLSSPEAFNKFTLSLEDICSGADPEATVYLECCLSCSISLDSVDLLVFISALTTPRIQDAFFFKGGDIVMKILIIHRPPPPGPRKKTWIPCVSLWVPVQGVCRSIGYSSCSTGYLGKKRLMVCAVNIMYSTLILGRSLLMVSIHSHVSSLSPSPSLGW